MGAIEEYSMLREEILDHMRRKGELEFRYIALCAAILAYPLGQANTKLSDLSQFYFYLPPLICLVATLFLTQHDRTIRGIATYLKVFLEDRGAGPRWESVLHQMRLKKLESPGVGKDIWFRETEVRALVPLGIMALSFAIRWTSQTYRGWFDIAASIVLFLVQILLIRQWMKIFSASEVNARVAEWEVAAKNMNLSG